MRNFLATWVVFQLIFIGIVSPMAYNYSIDKYEEFCSREIPSRIELQTFFILIFIPLFWFTNDYDICKD